MRYKAVLLFALLSSVLQADPVSVIYRNPDPSMYCRDLDRAGTVRYDQANFKKSVFRLSRNPLVVPVILSRKVYNGIELLSKTENVSPENAVEISKDGRGNIVFKDGRYNIHAVFSCGPAPDGLIEHIKASYTNSYWQDIVLKRYDDAYVFTFYGGNDLDRDGVFSLKDALALAALFGDRDQPLWGIHNGSGYLDNVYYSILTAEFSSTEAYYSYREPGVNSDMVTMLLKQIDAQYDDFPFGMYNTVTGMVQYEEDDYPKIYLPEEFLFRRDGDKLDFALAFYDLLMRKGYEVKLLMVNNVVEERQLDFITCYRLPETFVWSAVEMLGLHQSLSEELDDVPALIFEHSLSYAEIDPLYVMTRKRLPDSPEWRLSTY